ncbi:hypothetical protein Tco_0704520 [Tanacetum coccineum]|uniref:Uncharacterized protein n=1 Tax=Tanacetum coccineum TaxID=301880 RepID=A0ABQ4Y1W9_9ASTR
MTNSSNSLPELTVVIPTGAPATNTVANHAERPEKFNGQNFKRWQQKMFFYLTTLGLARFLKRILQPQEMSVEDLVVRLRIKEDNKLAQKDTYTPDSAKANMVEHVGSSSRFNSKGNKKDKKKNDKKGQKGSLSTLLLNWYSEDRSCFGGIGCAEAVNPRHANRWNEKMDMIAMSVDKDRSSIWATLQLLDIKGMEK